MGLALALLLAGCGGAHEIGPHISSVKGKWSGLPTSVSGEMVVRLTDISTRPVSFSIEDRWEETVDSESGTFKPELMRVKGKVAGIVREGEPDILELGPLQPGASTLLVLGVTSQEPGEPDGYTKVVTTQEGTGLRQVHILDW
jgi:hypothetical protein